VPQLEGWQISPFYKPAREVGGDFYDFHLLSEERLGVGLQSLFIFDDRGEIDWLAGVPLALGSAVGAYVAARLAAKAWTRVWVYRFLVVVVVLSIGHLVITDSGKYLQII
jgi:serine phosphatase RsbU (regulator of sigma subunit)